LWHYCAPNIEAINLHDRIYIAYIRKGLTTFAVFCLSLFVVTKDKTISGVGCRSPPFNLDFQKIQIGGKTVWLTTKPEKKRNGGSGKKPKKNS
jgi:hypothetical protein